MNLCNMFRLSCHLSLKTLNHYKISSQNDTHSAYNNNNIWYNDELGVCI